MSVCCLAQQSLGASGSTGGPGIKGLLPNVAPISTPGQKHACELILIVFTHYKLNLKCSFASK